MHSKLAIHALLIHAFIIDMSYVTVVRSITAAINPINRSIIYATLPHTVSLRFHHAPYRRPYHYSCRTVGNIGDALNYGGRLRELTLRPCQSEQLKSLTSHIIVDDIMIIDVANDQYSL